MNLQRIAITNYRNLDSISVDFHPILNFIVGENNLGKSNLLTVLNVLLYRGSFKESDFLRPSEEIRIEITLGLADAEIGLFEDLFDPADSKVINIVATQVAADAALHFHHRETGIPINMTNVRRANFLYYDSLRKPDTELNFYRNYGAGKFLHSLLGLFLSTDGSNEKKDGSSGKEVVPGELLADASAFLQEKIRLIKPMEQLDLHVAIEHEVLNVLGKLLSLRDTNDINVSESGHGVQYTSLIPLLLLDRLFQMSQSTRPEPVSVEFDKTVVPVILGLDEPEIHLHPFMQRSLIKYVADVCADRDEDFKSLLHDVTGYDGLRGQTIVVTHSPNILLNDYQHVVRFSKVSGSVAVANGSAIRLDPAERKQLLKNMPYVKEAFFSKCVILVEGDSEYGSLPIMAEKTIGDVDRLGISIVQTSGGDSIPPMSKLLTQFGISHIGVLDKDKETLYRGAPHLMFTDHTDFEHEVVASMNLVDYQRFMEVYYPDKAMFCMGDAKALGLSLDPKKDLSSQLAKLDEAVLNGLKSAVAPKVLDFLARSKSVLVAEQLAEFLSVPPFYERVLNEARRLATQ